MMMGEDVLCGKKDRESQSVPEYVCVGERETVCVLHACIHRLAKPYKPCISGRRFLQGVLNLIY